MVLVRFGNTPLERKPLEFEPDEDLSCLAYYQINPQLELDKNNDNANDSFMLC